MHRMMVMVVVVLMHGLLVGMLWFTRVELPRRLELPLFVEFLDSPRPALPVERPDKPPTMLPMRPEAPMPAVFSDAATAVDAQPAQAAPASATLAPATPGESSTAITTRLATELAVQCPERTPPRYPPLAKRQREQGEVRLQVELDADGRIEKVTILSSSGSPRLDEAARSAIESWRCLPAQHQGRPVRAVALQSLAFVLERR